MIPLFSMSRPARRISLALLIGTLVSQGSHACRMPPPAQTITPDALIAAATDVSVAKVVRATPVPVFANRWRQPVEYEFEVQQRILGPDQKRFVIMGAQGETRPRSSSSNHNDNEFWLHGGGRLYNDADCVLRPNFIVGESYRIFQGGTATWRSFEHIGTVDGRPDPDDKWLSYVIEKLERRK